MREEGAVKEKTEERQKKHTTYCTIYAAQYHPP